MEEIIKAKKRDKLNELARVNESIVQTEQQMTKLKEVRMVYLNQIEVFDSLLQELTEEKNDDTDTNNTGGDLPGGSFSPPKE